MKSIYKLFPLIFLFTLVVSCDPVHKINFINRTNSDVKVKINLNPKVQNYSLNKISANDAIVFNIKQNEVANINFGMGTWNEDEIDEVLKSIQSIEFETSEIKTIYKTKNSMKKILENNEDFWWKTNIEIEIV